MTIRVTYAIAFAVIALTGGHALAQSQRVQDACRNDYFAYCSQHALGSSGLRQCMRARAKQLSRVCRAALIASGER